MSAAPPWTGGRDAVLTRADGTWRVTTVLGIIALVTGGVALVGSGAGGAAGPPPRPASLSGTAPPDTTTAPDTGGAPTGALPAARPTRVDIAAIGVHAPVEPVGVDRAGVLEPPPLRRAHVAGWYRLGPTPGETGNAVIVGHVDTERSGPAVFYPLGRLVAGTTVEVSRADRTVAVFRVDTVVLVAKDAFPSDVVYGPAGRAQLRLVTCGGVFDRVRGGYLGNVVVTATLTSWHHA